MSLQTLVRWAWPLASAPLRFAAALVAELHERRALRHVEIEGCSCSCSELDDSDQEEYCEPRHEAVFLPSCSVHYGNLICRNAVHTHHCSLRTSRPTHLNVGGD